MKLLFMALIIPILSAYAFSQTCESCKDKEFIYHFCKNGQPYEKCTSAPYNETGCTLQKKCLPPIYIYDEDPYMQFSFYWDFDSDGFFEDDEYFFDANEAKQDASDALSEWTSICSPMDNTSCFDCPMHIVWSRDTRYFVKYPSCLGLHTTSYNPDCAPDCSNEFIYINITQDQTGWEPPTDPNTTVPTKRFFYTNPNHKSGAAYPLYSIKTTFLHEMGHWLGFGHQKENTFLWWGGCGDPSGIMSSNGNGLEPATDWSMSEDDKCMYMKIYCCPDEHTDVDEKQEISEGIQVFPNPTNNDFINIQLDNPADVNISFAIISQIGNVVATGNIQDYKHAKMLIIDNLVSGVYSILLKHDGKQEIKKFVVIK